MSMTTEAVASGNSSNPFFGQGLADADPELFASIARELDQQTQVELIASENIVSRA